jgi:hypothetical protein
VVDGDFNVGPRIAVTLTDVPPVENPDTCPVSLQDVGWLSMEIGPSLAEIY